MDIETLSRLFASTYDPNPNVQKAGELEIRRVGREEGMVTAVLHIIGNENVDIATRQAAAVYLKNRVHKTYSTEATGGRAPNANLVPIPKSDKDAVKAGLLPLLVQCPSKVIALQLANTLRTVVSHDFPERWPELAGTVKTLLSSTNLREINAGCVAILEVTKVFRYRTQSEVLERIINETFPQLVTIGAHVLSSTPTGASQEIPTILHYILKTYRSTIILNLSKHQQSHDSIVPWGQLLFQVVNLRIPDEAVPKDEDDREKCEWWKAKKWAYSTLDRLFHRYGNPSQMPSSLKADYLAFAEHFTNNFAPEIFKTYINQVDLLVQGQQWMSKKCQYYIFSFFLECIKSRATWVYLKPHFQTLVQSFAFPQLCFTPDKQELWETDPIEFIRTSIDEYEDFPAPVSAATTFILGLVNSRAKSTFMPILHFINSVLESNAPPQQKYGALSMSSVLAALMMRHPQIRNNVEQFAAQHVLPEMNSQLPYMRAIALEVLCNLEKSGMQWSKEENLHAASAGVAKALNDPELPVRVQAAFALNAMVQSHEYVVNAVRPEVGKVVTDLLKLSDECDIDLLNECMETMVEKFHAELLPVSSQLTARLCESYLRVLRENIAQESAENDDVENLNFEPATDMNDDKLFAAMGIAKTLSTIVSAVENQKDILIEVEQNIVPIVIFTLENKQIDLFDSVYELVDNMTFSLRQVSQPVWQIFELTYKLFKSDAIDFLEEMLPTLDNIISFGHDVIRTRPDYKVMILDIYTTTIRSEQLGEMDRLNACKLIESFLLNLRGEVDDALANIIQLAIDLRERTETRSLALANLETLINAVLYNPGAALHIMETQNQPPAARAFFDAWFAEINSEKGLPRVHDRKLSIVALCALLDLDAAAIPASLQDGWAGIVGAIVHVFQGLPGAVEKRKALEDLMKEDEEEEEEDANGAEPLTLEDDDDKDVWDEDSEYLEMLAKEGERLKRIGGLSAENGDDGESDTDSVESDIDEELGFISPLDSIDPYVTFKQSLTNFQMKNPALYAAATTSLNVEQSTALMEIMAIAEKNGTAVAQ